MTAEPPSDTNDRPRHTPTVPNPCGTTRDVLFVGDGVHVCEHIPDHAEAADDREHICCCGFVWNDSEVPTAPLTSEDRYWQSQARRARAERDALALGVLRLADAWVKEFGETGIRPEVCAATIRSAVETMGWP